MKSNARSALFVVAVLLAPLHLAAAQTPGNRSEARTEWAREGLQAVATNGLDEAYVQPAASIARYRKVMVSPPQVTFRSDWGRASSASVSSRPLARDVERIRTELAFIVQDALQSQLAADGFEIVKEPDDDVLELNAEVKNLYIQAPESAAIARTRTYAYSVGEMTLVAELRDSVTGDVAARVYDRAMARDTGQLRWINQAENQTEARNAARAWARAISQLLAGSAQAVAD